MRARICLGKALPVVAVVLMALPLAHAHGALTPCDFDDTCGVLTVPLDHAGVVPGTVPLRVDIERAKSPTKPPLVAILGEPGRASTEIVYAADEISWSLSTDSRTGDGRTREIPPPRDVIVLDLRGTGESGPLRCRALERSGPSKVIEAAAECAASLGARRGFYTARDSAEDVEALRKALGAEKIALLGASYGARVALTYAQRYPGRVARMLLQSPPPLGGEDLLSRPAFAAIPDVVAARCGSRACRRASRSPVADVVALAQRLEQGAINGSLLDGSGRPRGARIDALEFFRLLGGGGDPSLRTSPRCPAWCATPFAATWSRC
jgi:pimeloyl-ACP methyl ester carboxylesterase